MSTTTGGGEAPDRDPIRIVDLTGRKIRIVGLAGLKRSGKDTLAHEMMRMDGYMRMAMADALRAEIWAEQGVPPMPDSMKDLPLPGREDGSTYRDLMRHRGGARRLEHPEYWVRKVELAVRMIDTLAATHGLPWPCYVIPDVRMDNEIEWIRSMGGVIVWVRRPGITSDGHVTEGDLSEHADFIVVNDGSVEALHGSTMKNLAALADGLAQGS